jgi:hypothetical protein
MLSTPVVAAVTPGEPSAAPAPARWKDGSGVCFDGEGLVRTDRGLVQQRKASGHTGSVVASKRQRPVHFEALRDEPVALASLDDRVAAEANLRRKMDNWRRAHEVLGHRDSAVAELHRRGILRDVARPLNSYCHHCAAADESSVHFSHVGNTSRGGSDLPWAISEFDLWGPVNGEYVFGIIDRGTGESWVQPIPTKDHAVRAMEAFILWFNATKRETEMEFDLAPGTLRLSIMHFDRGGENLASNTTTKETKMITLLRSNGILPKPNSTDEARSGTQRIERLWGDLERMGKAAVYAASLLMKFLIRSMVMANRVRNVTPTESNKIGGGEAPWHTNGRSYDLAALAPIGALAIIRDKGRKGFARHHRRRRRRLHGRRRRVPSRNHGRVHRFHPVSRAHRPRPPAYHA